MHQNLHCYSFFQAKTFEFLIFWTQFWIQMASSKIWFNIQVILHSPTWMPHRNDYVFHCVIQCFCCKNPQVMATYLVNDTGDIDGPPHLWKYSIVINKIHQPKCDRLVPSAIEFYKGLSISVCVGFHMHQNLHCSYIFQAQILQLLIFAP